MRFLTRPSQIAAKVTSVLLSLLAATMLAAPLQAQFGGRSGDVVLYVVTYNGSGDFQTLSPGTFNTPAQISAIKLTHLADVPYQNADPFPLQRKVLYATPSETFQVGTDFENTVGLHRLYLMNVKILQLEGKINIVGNFVGSPNSFISVPRDLDVDGDISFSDVTIATWFPGAWPFMALTDKQGPYPCPPGLSGFFCFVADPLSIQLPSFMPWASLSSAYPSGKWMPGIDQKILFRQTNGVTIRQVRLRPGTQTPLIRTAGHSHVFVLQGAGMVTPVGAVPLSMVKYDYTLLPENTAVTFSNPVPYTGPTTR